MIPAMVAEFQLEGPAAQCDAGQLMSETDPEDRLTAHESADRIDRVCTRLRISRTIRQENSVRLECEYIFCWSLRRNHRNFASFTAQLAQNVLLDTEVVRNLVEPCGLILHSDHRNRFV